MESSDEWWSDVGQNYDEETYPTSLEIDALRAYVERRSSLAETLPRLMSTLEDERKLDWKSVRIGTMLRDVVLEFPSEHARLVGLLDAILHMKPEEMGWTDDQKARFPDWRTWPKPFGICSDINDQRDNYEYSRYLPRGPHGDVGITDMMILYATINAFFAHWNLVPNSPQKIEWGMHRLRLALEREIPSEGEAHEHSTASQYDIDIQGLAPYLLIDGKEIYARMMQRDAFPKAFPPDSERTDLIAAEDMLWHGQPGWSVERWNFWKQRLAEIKNCGIVRQDTKEKIDEVIQAMTLAEK